MGLSKQKTISGAKPTTSKASPKQRKSGADRESRRDRNAKAPTVLNAAMVPICDPSVSNRHSTPALGECRIGSHKPLDELAILNESQRIARIGSWWRTATEPAWWSEEMYDIYGVSPETFVPTREALFERIHPNDRDAVRSWAKAYEAGEKCHELEFRAILPDGAIRWISSHVRRELTGDQPFNFVGTAQDITERKLMEQNLLAALDYNRLLVDVSPIGVIVYRANGEAVSANEAAAKIVGGTVDQLLGQNFRELESWKRSGLSTLVEHALSFKRICENYVHLHPSTFGRECWLSIRIVPFYYKSEQHILLLFLDITEKKKIEEQNKLYVNKLETAFMQTVEVITALSELRDPYTAGHERRVAEIAVAIGAELGFDARRQQGLRVAGYLHDVGKINIPGEILSKPGKLSAAEFALIKEHPRAGYDVLKNVEFPWPIALVALQHHEQIDGSGYPQGLKGDEIILEARIMAVADVVESMSSHRPYRPALGFEIALAEIERGRGKAFDRDVVDACLRLFREKGYQLPA